MNDLVEAAQEAARFSYAPYSQFPVGAAVAGDDGKIYRGCNIESASYGLTVCAERVAIFSCIAAGARPLRLAVICVKGDAADPNSLMPCGACRQVMMDHLPLDAPVDVQGVGRFTVEELLPRGFRLPS